MQSRRQKAARSLESSFKGRITSFHEAQAEIRGKSIVLIPESAEDVGRALRLARAANRTVFVRSGHSVSASDLSSKAPAAAIVSMEAFRSVDVSDQRVTVGAAATTAEIAGKLAGTDLFLPLDHNPTQSVASAVLSGGASPFLRSGRGRGPLRDAVVQAEVVPTSGAGAGHPQTLRDKALRDVLAGTRPAVITSLVFDAAPAKADEADRWTQAWMTTYDPKTFAALCDALFGARGPVAVPERVDLSVRVTSAAFETTLVILRVSGHGEADGATTKALIDASIEREKLPVLAADRVNGAGAGVAAWLATGLASAAEGEVLRGFGGNAAPRPFAALRDAFLGAVDFAVGVDPETGVEHAPGVRASAELQLAPDGVVARAEISDANAAPNIALAAQQRFGAVISADRASPIAALLARGALVGPSAARDALRGADVLPEIEPTRGFDFRPSNRVGGIPGFRGDVFDKSDGRPYRDAIQQYAASSYAPQIVAERMTPRYVAVPLDAADAATAVNFASANGLKVVTRSGGHQYCGLSSGGDDTLLLDMRRFTRVLFSPPTGTPTQVTVGPGVALKEVSKWLAANGVTIPHGECPLVKLGGHVQTGGIGHQLRSLGCTLDWVSSFKMVTRVQQAGPDIYAERTFTRPQPDGNAGAPTDEDVFRAVLGGGPGSWGVLTEITFDLIADTAYPASAGFSYTYLYASSGTGFDVAMAQLEQWAALQARGDLPEGIDLFISVVSGTFELSLLPPVANMRPAALIVETMSRDAAGVAKIQAVVDAVSNAGWLPPYRSINGGATLSHIADAGVRQIGAFGLPPSGREFDYPYKKSLHITMTPFAPGFVAGFVALVNRVYQRSDLKVVVQTAVGGGDFSVNGQRQTTHMQRRAGLVQLVFDVFYKPGSEPDAVGFQNDMKGLLTQFSGGADVRMAWGTFEDASAGETQLDMRRKEVQALYYDTLTGYARLQEIKTYTDPKDIFHTSFTVQ